MSMFPQSGAERRPVELEYGTTERSMLNFFNAVYAWMAVGLALTAAVAWFVAHTPSLVNMINGSKAVIVVASLGMLGISLAAQSMAMRVSATVTTALFLLYAALMGAFISYIFLIYKLPTILAAFGVTGGVFATMSVFGYVTKRDLTTIGSYAIMALWGLILASIVNLFVASNALSWVITYGVVLLTIAIIAYETQKLKEWAIQFEGQPAMLSRLAAYGSLVLYISFINLFLAILRIMGSRK